MAAKTAGRIIGACLLLAMVFYGGGSYLVDTAVGGVPAQLAETADHRAQLSTGALLMLANSALVMVMGLVALPILMPHDRVAAYAYLIARTFEAVLLAVGVVFLLLLGPLSASLSEASDVSALDALATTAQQGSVYAYWFAMIGLGLGSLLFCRVLLRAHLVPAAMAVWGLIGYALLSIGGVLEVLDHNVGLVLSIPGGLFEVVLGIVLLARGFAERPPGALATSEAVDDDPVAADLGM